MKRIPILLLVLAALLPATASAQTRYATRTLSLRDAPAATAEQIGNIPAGAAVQVRGCQFGGGEWCAVEYARVSGYARRRYLVASDTSASPRGAAGGRAPSPASAPRTTRRSSASGGRGRSSSTSRQYIRGPRGGCYYISDSGRKQYVERWRCD